MKKSLKILCIIIGIIIVLGIIFFFIKYISKNKINESNYIEHEIKEVEESESKIYIKEVEDIIINLNIPKEWNYEETVNPENQNAKFELKVYKDSKEKYASLLYYNNMFGVCGTGLTSKKLTLNNGLEANVGYYDESKVWTFVGFHNLNPNLAFWNNGLDEEESNELLGIVKTIIVKNRT